MGAEADDELIYTPSQLALLLDSEEATADAPVEAPPVDPPAQEEGLMTSPSADAVEEAPEEEQQSMLGMAEEEENPDGVA